MHTAATSLARSRAQLSGEVIAELEACRDRGDRRGFFFAALSVRSHPWLVPSTTWQAWRRADDAPGWVRSTAVDQLLQHDPREAIEALVEEVTGPRAATFDKPLDLHQLRHAPALAMEFGKRLGAIAVSRLSNPITDATRSLLEAAIAGGASDADPVLVALAERRLPAGLREREQDYDLRRAAATLALRSGSSAAKAMLARDLSPEMAVRPLTESRDDRWLPGEPERSPWVDAAAACRVQLPQAMADGLRRRAAVPYGAISQSARWLLAACSSEDRSRLTDQMGDLALQSQLDLVDALAYSASDDSFDCLRRIARSVGPDVPAPVRSSAARRWMEVRGPDDVLLGAMLDAVRGRSQGSASVLRDLAALAPGFEPPHQERVLRLCQEVVDERRPWNGNIDRYLVDVIAAVAGSAGGGTLLRALASGPYGRAHLRHQYCALQRLAERPGAEEAAFAAATDVLRGSDSRGEEAAIGAVAVLGVLHGKGVGGALDLLREQLGENRNDQVRRSIVAQLQAFGDAADLQRLAAICETESASQSLRLAAAEAGDEILQRGAAPTHIGRATSARRSHPRPGASLTSSMPPSPTPSNGQGTPPLRRPAPPLDGRRGGLGPLG